MPLSTEDGVRVSSTSATTAAVREPSARVSATPDGRTICTAFSAVSTSPRARAVEPEEKPAAKPEEKPADVPAPGLDAPPDDVVSDSVSSAVPGSASVIDSSTRVRAIPSAIAWCARKTRTAPEPYPLTRCTSHSGWFRSSGRCSWLST